jgi:hypothetical protein
MYRLLLCVFEETIGVKIRRSAVSFPSHLVPPVSISARES